MLYAQNRAQTATSYVLILFGCSNLNSVSHKESCCSHCGDCCGSKWIMTPGHFIFSSIFILSPLQGRNYPCILKPQCVLPAATRPACATHQHLSSPILQFSSLVMYHRLWCSPSTNEACWSLSIHQRIFKCTGESLKLNDNEQKTQKYGSKQK